jgi:cytidylate kinase
MDLAYDNITISGGIAVGKTTLLKNLMSYLEPLGWKFRSIGDIHRTFLNDNVMPEASKVSDEFDRKIETEVLHILSTEKKQVIQAWISGFVARELINTLRVLLICKENSLRVDRVANRDHISIQEAKNFIKQREEGNLQKYKRLYGDYSFWDPKYYHLVIDTYANSQMECVDLVLNKLGYSKP